MQESRYCCRFQYASLCGCSVSSTFNVEYIFFSENLGFVQKRIFCFIDLNSLLLLRQLFMPSDQVLIYLSFIMISLASLELLMRFRPEGCHCIMVVHIQKHP